LFISGQPPSREDGLGTRSAVGMTLTGNIAVEIEAVFEINE
jgi:hypothetical protein